MKHENQSVQTLSRRSLLGQAAGAAALAATAQAQPAAENSAPRSRDSFDFGWKFFKGDAPGALQPDFTDTAWRSVDLPHDWSIEGPFSEKEPAQASLPAGIGWYRKRFNLPEAYRGRMVTIEFGGIYENSEVWINGQYLGKRPYGYIPFSYDLR
jgi:beta-galactosidase